MRSASRSDLLATLRCAADRRRQTALALRRHRSAVRRLLTESSAETARLVRIQDYIDAEIDALLDALGDADPAP